ncbi:peptidase [Sporosarcina luteola]|uniref:Peptidase n=1 Tax=Sporosarcina luteola TaxID=582850 RepID=A0A511Z2W8_9BACL|nr:TldD/PmbA family protein [Sporosarcina luteola]GEN81798.1 peptidase [Sporosarcina luteola]
MNIQDFQIELFNEGTEMGFEEMEIFYSSSKAVSISIYHQEIDDYTIMEEGGVSFRGLYKGKMGYAYAERIAIDSIPLLLEEALNNTLVIEVDDGEDLFEGSTDYAEPRPFAEALEKLEPEEMIQAAMELERIAYKADERVEFVQAAYASKVVNESLIANTKGLHCHSKGAFASAGLYLTAQDGESTATGGESDFTMTAFSELNMHKIAEKAVKEAVSKLNASSIMTGSYPIIFRYDTATELVGSFLGQLSAESVQQGYSKLKGKLNEQIAGENITFVDDPLMKDAITYATFDSEGFATRKKDLIRNGKLLTFMHNRKTAKKDGVESTGNAVKGGFRSMVGVGPYNLYLEPGSSSLDEMIAQAGNAILIVELQGTNAGINYTSGDFSLASIGFLIEDGKITRTIDQFTIAGNIFDVLNDISTIGSDLRIRGSITLPSIKVNALQISGNQSN